MMGFRTQLGGSWGGPRRARRHGFTLVEVLIASTIMVIGLVGIMSMAFTAIKKADAPADVQEAIHLCQDRLDYFRNQTNPFRAVGGTWYQPPQGQRVTYDFNLSPDGDKLQVAYNGTTNGCPALFVREYLYGFQELRYGRDAAGNDQARLLLDARNTGNMNPGVGGGMSFAPNEIPPTPDKTLGGANVMGVVPNPETNAAYGGSENYVFTGFMISNPPNLPAPGYAFTYAPRANDTIRATAGGVALPAAIKYVREVWIQTNNPNYGAGLDGRCPAPGGVVGPNMQSFGVLGGFGGLGNATLVPGLQANLPPYTVAVTVRVFSRDVQTKTLTLSAGLGPTNVRNLPVNSSTSGPGYARNRPLATMVGYFGLRRM